MHHCEILLQLSMDDGAYFANKETVFSQEATKCQMLMPWETEFPNLLGMAVAKESVYYEMLMFRTLKQMDMGTWQVTDTADLQVTTRSH